MRVCMAANHVTRFARVDFYSDERIRLVTTTPNYGVRWRAPVVVYLPARAACRDPNRG